MTDLSKTIAPRSDQLNADDLITGPRTIKIRAVAEKGTGRPGDQPTWIYFEGDNNKPYKPGLAMRRVLIELYGVEGDDYIGQSLTLYRDTEVQFGGVKVGGIRISHATGLTEARDFIVTTSKTSRKPFRVEPLTVAAPPPGAKKKPAATAEEKLASAKEKAREIVAEINAASTAADVIGLLTKHAALTTRIGTVDVATAATINDAATQRIAALAVPTGEAGPAPSTATSPGSSGAEKPAAASAAPAATPTPTPSPSSPSKSETGPSAVVAPDPSQASSSSSAATSAAPVGSKSQPPISSPASASSSPTAPTSSESAPDKSPAASPTSTPTAASAPSAAASPQPSGGMNPAPGETRLVQALRKLPDNAVDLAVFFNLWKDVITDGDERQLLPLCCAAVSAALKKQPALAKVPDEKKQAVIRAFTEADKGAVIGLEAV